MNRGSCISCMTGVLYIFFWGITCLADGLTPFKSEKGNIKIAGGTAHIPVMQEAAKRIMGYNRDIQISITGGGSGVGIKQVGEGLVDIGNTGRIPTNKEISTYNLKMFKWAIDGIGVVVNPENKVTSLTKEQVKKIFAGTLKNWIEVGGWDKRINLYTRDEASGTRNVFWKKALDKGTIAIKAHFVASNGAMKASISNDPYGIGYVSVGHIDQSVSPVSFDGIAPSVENIIAGTYTIARGIFSNTRGKPNGLTKKFIDYFYTEEMQKIIRSKGFIAVSQ